VVVRSQRIHEVVVRIKRIHEVVVGIQVQKATRQQSVFGFACLRTIRERYHLTLEGRSE
jgi:hypothetical protein